jgi:nucleotide-binding universal stress UspA family protein
VIEKILVPMDGSRQSAKALVYAIEVASRFGAEIILLRVVTLSMLSIAHSTPSSGGPVIKGDFLKEAERQDRKTMSRMRQYVRGKLKTVTAHGVKGAYRVMTGDPADSIIACCRDEAIDLVVMSAKNKGWWRRTILGSVTDEVLKSAGIPVLVIRPGRKH